MIERQKAESGRALVSTVLFDDQSEVIHDRIDIRLVPSMTEGSRRWKTRKMPLYPYEALVNLCALWLEFRRSVALPDTKTVQSALGTRTTIFLRYIARHRGEPFTLNFIAESAHVSKSECLRCFKASLRTTPYQYPTEYRLSRAAEFLHTTDKTR